VIGSFDAAYRLFIRQHAFGLKALHISKGEMIFGRVQQSAERPLKGISRYASTVSRLSPFQE
jgi:hypothetical protein